MTASRVEASFDVGASRALGEAQRELLLARVGTRLAAVAQDDRSQARNRQLALRRLKRALDEALAVVAPRRPTRPSAAARKRRLQDKRRSAARKAQRRPPDAEE